MKRLTLLLAGLAGLSINTARAVDAPHGSLVELHSCQLYAGACVVSSEMTQEGRYMLRAWQFTGGSADGVNFAGLRLAVLQTSPDNLGLPSAKSGDAVVYLPRDATKEQRAALMSWLKSSEPNFHPASVRERVVALNVSHTGQDYAISAGSYVSVTTAPFDACPVGNCNESLWYAPRSTVNSFSIAVNHSSEIAEPLLKLKWNEHFGQHTVFLGQFGQPQSTKPEYVSMAAMSH